MFAYFNKMWNTTTTKKNPLFNDEGMLQTVAVLSISALKGTFTYCRGRALCL